MMTLMAKDNYDDSRCHAIIMIDESDDDDGHLSCAFQSAPTVMNDAAKLFTQYILH